MTTPPPTTLLVDCDTGIDDALALLYLLRTPWVDLTAVTTVAGNVTATQAAHNSLATLALGGRPDVPVAAGAERTSSGGSFFHAPDVHGTDGLGGAALPAPTARPRPGTAADLIIETARAHRGDLSILAIAPLTNLAIALENEPRIADWVRDVTVMGGAIHHPGNGTAAAEANILNDPEAAEIVLNAGWPLTLVPLDATMNEVLTERHRGHLLSDDSAAARFAGEALDVYFGFHHGRHFPDRGGACHDPYAAAIASGAVVPDLAPRLHVAVDTAHGIARGATIADSRGMYRGYPPSTRANATVVLRSSGTFPAQLVTRLCSSRRRLPELVHDERKISS